MWVDDVDASAATAEAAGGAVVYGPMDVMDAGRMAVVTDPEGSDASSSRCAPRSTFNSPRKTCCAIRFGHSWYIDANRASWIVMYTQATSSQAFAHTVREGRERIIELVGRLLRAGTRKPEWCRFESMAVALVGAGEAIASRVSTGDTGVDEAGELMIDLFWRGLKEAPGGRDGSDAAAAG